MSEAFYNFPLRSRSLFSITGSIVFLLKGNKESGFSFEGLATCISSTTGGINVRVAKVLKENATLPSSCQPLQEGQAITWSENLIALYRTPAVQEKPSNSNNSKGTQLLCCDWGWGHV